MARHGLYRAGLGLGLHNVACTFENIGVAMFCFLCPPQHTWHVDLLAPGSDVFYLRGTTGECVPATVVGPSSFAECFAISYEHSCHTQLYPAPP